MFFSRCFAWRGGGLAFFLEKCVFVLLCVVMLLRACVFRDFFFFFFLALNAPLPTVPPATSLRICLVPVVVVAAVLLPLVGKALGKEVQARLSALGSFHPSQRGKLTDLRDLNGRADKKVRDIYIW